MDSANNTPTTQDDSNPVPLSNQLLLSNQLTRSLGFTALGIIVFSQPVLAQDVGAAFCQTSLAQTIKNVFTLIQFGGPLVGGVVALGAAVLTPVVSRVDLKKELKETRNQALVWGVLVAPLGTALLQFLLNNVVAGGASCTF
ncbi:hypothetical protein [Halobacterium wangiae]|uniref:hypothetical protein n=1 Tax=Halobacterium wangiae TaxID=2902623 RepID=UPI001E2F4EA6|nr:hypothetical protein [Halobacterium wangiae]